MQPCLARSALQRDMSTSDQESLSLAKLLVQAINDGDIQTVQDLVSASPAITTCQIAERGGQTALHVAALNGRADLVRYFLSFKIANVNQLGPEGSVPLLVLICQQGQFEIAQILLDSGADAKFAPPDKEFVALSAISHLAHQGKLQTDEQDLRQAWIVAKAALEQRSVSSTRGGLSALHAAAAIGHFPLVRLLIEKGGADVNAAHYRSYETPLHCAARSGNPELVQLLIEHGAQLNVASHVGNTPLHYAAICGHMNVVQLLIYEGANPLSSNNFGRTPLHGAALNGNPVLVEFLVLECHAQVEQVHCDIALQAGNQALYEFFAAQLADSPPAASDFPVVNDDDVSSASPPGLPNTWLCKVFNGCGYNCQYEPIKRPGDPIPTEALFCPAYNHFRLYGLEGFSPYGLGAMFPLTAETRGIVEEATVGLAMDIMSGFPCGNYGPYHTPFTATPECRCGVLCPPSATQFQQGRRGLLVLDDAFLSFLVLLFDDGAVMKMVWQSALRGIDQQSADAYIRGLMVVVWEKICQDMQFIRNLPSNREDHTAQLSIPAAAAVR